jgi:uncharacterized membrane protein
MTGAAAKDEQAELRALREAADKSAREAGDTIAALAGKLAEARHPERWLRRYAAVAGHQAVQSTRHALNGAGQATRQFPAKARTAGRSAISGTMRRPALAGLPAGAIALVAALVVLRRRYRR